MLVFHIKKGALKPILEAVLDTKVAGNLTGATAMFIMKTQAGDTLINRSISITDAPGGVVEVAWQAGETETVGSHWAEIWIQMSDGSPMKFPPGEGYINVNITQDLS